MFDHKIKQCHSFLKALFMLIFRLKNLRPRKQRPTQMPRKRKRNNQRPQKINRLGQRGHRKKVGHQVQKFKVRCIRERSKFVTKIKSRVQMRLKLKKYHYDVEERLPV